MACWHPPACPPQLGKPSLAGERAIWNALREATTPAHAHIFYNRRPKGSRRAPDFLWLDPQRGLINIEVKGGMVHFAKGFRQTITTHRKSIDPWSQAKLALRDLFTALDIAALPHAVMLAVPAMRASAFAFGDSPHILTADDIAEHRTGEKIEALLPVLDPDQQRQQHQSFTQIIAALTRAEDGQPD